MADEKYYQAELDNRQLFQLWRDLSPEGAKNYNAFLHYLEESYGIRVREKGNIMQISYYDNARYNFTLNGMLHEAPMYCSPQILKKYEFKEVPYFNE